jgi:pyruvate kinase
MERLSNGKRLPSLIAKLEKPEALDNLDAILDNVDGVMVARGDLGVELPLERVPAAQKDIIRTGVNGFEQSDAASMARAAQALANDKNVTAVACFTAQGKTAWLISKIRPRVPIMAFTSSQDTYRQLTFMWGVQPQKIEFANSLEEMLDQVDAALMRSHVVQPGDQVVLVCGFPIGAQRPTNMAFLHTVGEQ